MLFVCGTVGCSYFMISTNIANTPTHSDYPSPLEIQAWVRLPPPPPSGKDGSDARTKLDKVKMRVSGSGTWLAKMVVLSLSVCP